MANPKTPTTTSKQPEPPAPSAPAPAVHEEQLPTFDLIGWARVPGKGFVVARITTQGDRVLSRRILEGPVPKAQAMEVIKISAVRELFYPGDAK